MPRNQNLTFIFYFRLQFDFFSIFFSPFLLLLFFSFFCIYWPSTGLASSSKKFWEIIIEMGIFYHVVATCSHSFFVNFLSIFMHISGSIEPITVIWVTLERSCPPAEAEHRWYQIWSKVMTSKVEQMPRLVMAGYEWQRSQWVNKSV